MKLDAAYLAYERFYLSSCDPAQSSARYRSWRKTRASIRRGLDALRGAGVTEADRVSRKHVQAVRDAHRGMSAHSLNKTLSMLRTMWAYLEEQEVVRSNPFAGVRRAKAPAYSPRVLSKAEVGRLLHNVADDPMGPMIACAVYTGLRNQELAHLRWEDVADGWLHVRSDRDRTTKSRKPRWVPLPDPLMPWLYQAKGLCDGLPLVFPGPRARHRREKPMSDQRVSDYIRRISDRLGLCFRIHDLRRTCITDWFERGLPVHVIMGYAGHQSIETTQRYYLPRNDRTRQHDARTEAYEVHSEPARPHNHGGDAPPSAPLQPTYGNDLSWLRPTQRQPASP